MFVDRVESNCSGCNLSNKRKNSIKCFECNEWSHLGCIKLSRVQAEALPRWLCQNCLDIQNRPSIPGLAIHSQTLPAQQNNSQTQDIQLNQQIGPAPAEVFDIVGCLSGCRKHIKVLQKIPRGARIQVADALSKLLNETTNNQSLLAWSRLLCFGYFGLEQPVRKATNSGQTSLTTKIKNQVEKFMETTDYPIPPDHIPDVSLSSRKRDQNHLAKRVNAKFMDLDIKGAVRELSTSNDYAPNNDDTLQQLKEKHPESPIDLDLPGPPDFSLLSELFSEVDVMKAIGSFPPGSAAGPDGLRPCHLKTLLSHGTAEAGTRLLSSLTKFVNMVLNGGVLNSIKAVFFGANLFAFNKKDGGVRPIAVGGTLRRLATKVGAKPLAAALGTQFRPIQLGYSTKGGCEAAAHAARNYVNNLNHSRVFLKIDMKNAFNTIRRDCFLKVVKERTPSMFKHCWQAYSEPSVLFYNDIIMGSKSGIQQGDPFGPCLFSLGIDSVARDIQSELNLWYLDDATFGDTPEKVFSVVDEIIPKLNKIGLDINSDKCELTILNPTSNEEKLNTESLFKSLLPNLKMVESDACTLLGAPLSERAIPGGITEKHGDLCRMVDRLEGIDSHQAFVLLKNCFSIPKLQYLLRVSPAFLCMNELKAFDQTLRGAVGSITNVDFDEASWKQATLPVKQGGLGIRRSQDIALPGFISSLYASSPLVDAVLSRTRVLATAEEKEEAVSAWIESNVGANVPNDELKCNQKSWDVEGMKVVFNGLLSEANQISRARLLAASTKESGLWLHAVPVSSLGTNLDPESFRIAIALRVGAQVCQNHLCRCGRQIDTLGLHGLSCRFSAGRHQRHAALNDIVKRALQRCGLPAILEPLGMDRVDGKRPDGVTVFPFKIGKSLVWDCTCSDTFSVTQLYNSAVLAGSAASDAEAGKRKKYATISNAYIFEHIAIETTCVFGKSTSIIINEIGSRLVSETGE